MVCVRLAELAEYVKRQYVAADPLAVRRVIASVEPSLNAEAEPMETPVVEQPEIPEIEPPPVHHSLPPTVSASPTPSTAFDASLKSKVFVPFDHASVDPPEGAIVTDQVGVAVGFSMQNLCEEGARTAVELCELKEKEALLKLMLGLTTSVLHASLVMRRLRVPSEMV